MRLDLAQIASCLGVTLAGGQGAVEISGAAIDSRQVSSGDIFVCLPGEKVDGHDFAKAAEARGCAAVLASRELPDVSVPVLVVPRPQEALATLARYWRGRTRARVVCITGTAGKTTLKDTLTVIMARKGKTAATRGNHNNQLGLPLTVLNAAGDEDFWILEAGISHAGDMDLLGDIARPDLAVILNVGPGHTEGLGDKGVAWHKARLLRYLAPGGCALVNGDIPELTAACDETEARVVLFSRRADADCPFRILSDRPHHQTVCLDGEELPLATPFTGVSGAENVLAAAAAAHMLGANGEQIASGLAHVQLPPQRFHHRQMGNAHIFDDTYNANPLSMERMLSAAADFAGEHKLPLYLLLGEMGELGEDAPRWHYKLGEQLAILRPRAVFWKGSYGEYVAAGMVAGGYDRPLSPVSDRFAEEFRAMAGCELARGFVLLAKGSRVNRLEKQVHALQALWGDKADAL